MPPSPRTVSSLSRAIGTVLQLWDEWTVGIEGKPAVQDLERSYGPAWRPSASEHVLFSRRKIIVDEIQARITVSRCCGERGGGKHSLYRLSQLLTNSRRRLDTWESDSFFFFISSLYIFKGPFVEYIFILKGLRLLRLCLFHDGTQVVCLLAAYNVFVLF
jgi:hypothetical protein